ncbi:MAG: D-alanine--D-alanine ligase [Bacteroidetes bacterium]|nr:D-alanine--D-alanine ligase [Bacteroidota bacterium]
MKKNIAVVTGGYSGEAVISLKSAEVVMKHLDAEKYNCYKVILSKDKWVLAQEGKEYSIDKNDFSAMVSGNKIHFHCVFMALHGTPGEDGKLQGYFDMIGMPYTSCGVVQSAITFNKAFTVAVLSRYGVNTAQSMVVNKKDKITVEEILAKVSLPCFVKPNEGGSSLGASKVKQKEELLSAVEKALKVGEEAIVEEFIEGTELTCGVIRYKGKVKALAISEVVCSKEVFDFEAKYIDKSTEEITPARIPITTETECKNLSEYIYTVLGCRGMIRIDYILKKNTLYLLEVNSIPGLTERSFVPQQAEYAGISKKELFGNAIEEVLQ